MYYIGGFPLLSSFVYLIQYVLFYVQSRQTTKVPERPRYSHKCGWDFELLQVSRDPLQFVWDFELLQVSRDPLQFGSYMFKCFYVE